MQRSWVLTILFGTILVGWGQTPTSRPPTYIGGYTGILFNTQNGSFFDRYAQLGSSTTEFPPAIVTGGETLIALSPYWNIGATIAYYELRLNDYYSTAVQYGDTVIGFRSFQQQVLFQVLPVMARLEWSPYTLQFRTHVGVQGGIAAITLQWYETVQSSIPLDQRQGGTRLFEEAVVPAFGIHALVSLGFDQFYFSRSILYGITIGAAYTYIPLRRAFFQGFPPISPAFSSTSFTVNAGGLLLQLGLRLRF